MTDKQIKCIDDAKQTFYAALDDAEKDIGKAWTASINAVVDSFLDPKDWEIEYGCGGTDATARKPKKKKIKKIWFDEKRYKAVPAISLSCKKCAFYDTGGCVCPDLRCDNIIWKLSMPKSHPLMLDNWPKNFTPERYYVERLLGVSEWVSSKWNNCELTIVSLQLNIADGRKYRYTKKAPK